MHVGSRSLLVLFPGSCASRKALYMYTLNIHSNCCTTNSCTFRLFAFCACLHLLIISHVSSLSPAAMVPRRGWAGGRGRGRNEWQEGERRRREDRKGGEVGRRGKVERWGGEGKKGIEGGEERERKELKVGRRGKEKKVERWEGEGRWEEEKREGRNK